MRTDAATRDADDARDTRHAGAGDDEPSPRVSYHATSHPLSPRARRKLVNLLVGKSVLEALLVAALAVAFYHAAFNPSFRGSLDLATPRSVEGWVVDAARPAARVEVQLYLDGRFAASAYADQPRPDVRDAGWAPDELHGFRFPLNVMDAGEHEARVYAVHPSGGDSRRTLQLIGRPLRFRVPG